jgi:hypothetical protein
VPPDLEDVYFSAMAGHYRQKSSPATKEALR